MKEDDLARLKTAVVLVGINEKRWFGSLGIGMVQSWSPPLVLVVFPPKDSYCRYK